MESKTDRKDIFSHVLALNDERGLSLPELEATAAIIILAGSESTSTMLTGTTNLLMRNPEKLAKLASEIRNTFQQETDITLDAVEQLPYLRAVFQESFRLLPPVPTQIPRIVPPEGDTICGHFLPGNVSPSSSLQYQNPSNNRKQTFVGLPQYAAYRSPQNFIHPSCFLPERWLPTDSPLFTFSPSGPPFNHSSFVNDNRNVVQPFSVGPRNCIGTNLAYAEMRLVLSRLLWNVDLSFPVGEEGLVFEDQKTYALWEREAFRVKLSWVR